VHDERARHSRRNHPICRARDGFSRCERDPHKVLRHEALARSPDDLAVPRDEKLVPAGAEQERFVVVRRVRQGQCHVNDLALVVRRLVGRQANRHIRQLDISTDFGLHGMGRRRHVGGDV
jgi:hypothetical protein